MGDMINIRERIARLVESNSDFEPFANETEKLATSFEDEKIIELLEKHKESQG